MIGCDLAAASVFVTVPVASALGDLSAVQLLLVALAAGCFDVLFETAYRVYLLTLVTDPGERATTNSALQGSASAATVGGPGLGGVLVQALGDTVALLADSVSFLVSAACLLAMRSPPRHHATEITPARLRQRVADGIAYLRHEPPLRSLTLFGGAANLALIGYQSVLVVFLVRDTHLQAGEVGLVLALSGTGGVTGSLIARPLARRVGSARALLLTKTIGGASALLIPLATSPSRAGYAIAGGFLVGAGIVAGNIITTTFIQTYVPEEVFARTATTNNVVNYGTIPLGAVLGGTLATTLGLTTALWITTAMVPLATGFLLTGPLPHLRDLPTHPPLSDTPKQTHRP